MTRRDLIELSARIQMDLGNAQAKLVELRSHIAQLPIPDTGDHLCPRCGLTFHGPRGLAEHMYHQHGGPPPEHWLNAEAATKETP